MRSKYRNIVLEEINRIQQELLKEIGSNQLIDNKNFRVVELNRELDHLKIELSDTKH